MQCQSFSTTPSSVGTDKLKFLYYEHVHRAYTLSAVALHKVLMAGS